MTHRTDCTVKPEQREKVDRVAELYWQGNKDEAERLAERLGWEKIGGGAGRSVWEVSVEDQTGGVESATEQSPCVVKFAIPGHRWDGKTQNREEVAQFETFPPEITEADPPVVVPIKDYDSDDYLWLSAPKVDPDYGDIGEVSRRLGEFGWDCNDDLHYDNVGAMHETSVMLDYGVTCRETATASELTDEIERYMERTDSEIISIEGSGQTVTVEFMPPEWANGPSPPDPSSLHMMVGKGADYAELVFGKWPEEDRQTIEANVDHVIKRVENEWFGLDVIPDVLVDGGGVSVEFGVRFEDLAEPGGIDWPPDIFRDVYEDFLAGVDEEIIDATDPETFLSDVKAAMRDEGAFGTGGGQSDGRVATWNFEPPEKYRFSDRTSGDSWVSVDKDGFREMRMVFGQWRPDEPHRPTINDGVQAVRERVQSDWPDHEVHWNKLDVPRTMFQTGSEKAEIAIIVTATDDELTKNLEPDEIASMMNIIGTSMSEEMPAPREAGGPVQVELDDIEARINGALSQIGLGKPSSRTHAAICPTGDRCDAQAESYAADLYDHIHGGMDIDFARINEDIADMVNRNADGAAAEVSRGDLYVQVGDDELGPYDFWHDVKMAGKRAPDGQEAFIETVSDEILGYAEDVLDDVSAAGR